MNDETKVNVPEIIGWRVDKQIKPLLLKWRKENPAASWRRLIRRAVLSELKHMAGKRHSHLYQKAA